MNVEFSRRAAADLRKIGADSVAFGQIVAVAVETRIKQAIEQIARHPEAGPRVANRPGVRVLPLVRYPYRIFYRVLDGRVRILHIRHTSRRPWLGG